MTKSLNWTRARAAEMEAEQLMGLLKYAIRALEPAADTREGLVHIPTTYARKLRDDCITAVKLREARR